MKKLILFLTVVIVFNVNVFAKSIDDVGVETSIYEILPRNQVITRTTNNLEIASEKAKCYGVTVVTKGYKAKIKVELQKKGTSWKTIETWEILNNLSASINEYYTVRKGGTYRLKTTHYAIGSSGNIVENITKYSKTITC